MKIGIIIPLKARSVSKNWEVTCDNLLSTVTSVNNQNNMDFSAAVVGHDQPDFMTKDDHTSHCQFIRFTEIPPPITGELEQENQLKYEVDRCSKILKGIMTLQSEKQGITHWFSLDADDLLRCDFIQNLKSYSHCDGIILDKGYSYFKSTGIINKENEFSAYCGSSAVLSNKLFQLPEKISADSFRQIPFGETSHMTMKSSLIGKGHNTITPKERIIMYVRNNGENISNAAYYDTKFKKIKVYVKMILKSVWLNSTHIKKAFGITPPSPLPAKKSDNH